MRFFKAPLALLCLVPVALAQATNTTNTTVTDQQWPLLTIEGDSNTLEYCQPVKLSWTWSNASSGGQTSSGPVDFVVYYDRYEPSNATERIFAHRFLLKNATQLGFEWTVDEKAGSKLNIAAQDQSGGDVQSVTVVKSSKTCNKSALILPYDADSNTSGAGRVILALPSFLVGGVSVVLAAAALHL